ncbi:hypothetical protein HU200_017222 [Digitaria exilis]|uniref:UspA domain-containing protein n=1 Tax=Digitaria exilis TaxID=1010633 RepID=A0A835F729_9POAL|nr:hypothetical protein HU200_017222 [Digitaria exilis]CAB3451224.1 unnamed protein product [Digitaria exilis]
MTAEKRTIGMAMDYSPSSKAAARWAVDNLVKAGDRIILVHVLPKGSDASHKELWKSTGSPLTPLPEFMETTCRREVRIGPPDKEILDVLQTAS